MNTNTKVARPVYVDVLAQPAPFLERYPWVGYTIFIVFGLLLVLLTQQVLTNGPFLSIDEPLGQNIRSWATHQPGWVAFPMRFFSSYGRDGVSLITLVLAIGWMRKNALRELRMLLFGVMGAELWFQILSNVVMRHRPAYKDPLETLIGPGYPSGHAATNLVLAWMVCYLFWRYVRPGWRRWLMAAIAVLYVAVVCFSRLYLGVHYPTDILGGLLLGAAWGGLIFTLIDVLHWRGYRQHVAIQPPYLGRPAAIPVTSKEKREG